MAVLHSMRRCSVAGRHAAPLCFDDCSFDIKSRAHPDPVTLLTRSISTLLAASLAALAPATARAQDAGRWVLVVEGGIPPYLRGELRIQQQPTGFAGTLALEDADTLLRVADIRVVGDSLWFEVPLVGGLEFSGRRTTEGFAGSAAASDGLPRRWSASHLGATREYYPSAPRFTMRQIDIASAVNAGVIPGRWAEPALGPGRLAVIDSAYRRSAAQAGWRLLEGAALSREREIRALGLADRRATLDLLHAALADIAAGITDPEVRRQFADIFRPGGRWVADLHEAAQWLAAARQSGWRLEATAPALKALGYLPADSVDETSLLSAAYRLRLLGSTDSTALRQMLRPIDGVPRSSQLALEALLDGYGDAEQWQARALRFLLEAPWLPAGLPSRSVKALVRRGPLPTADSTPLVESRLFGAPQAVARAGTSDTLVRMLVHLENPSALAWYDVHGARGLLGILHLLPAAVDSNTALAGPAGEIHLTSCRAEAAVAGVGFLEAADAVVIEPAIAPLLALGTVVHEWVHILYERAWQEGGGWTMEGASVARLRLSSPVLSEGVAEWQAEAILAPVASRIPLVWVLEAEKRAAMAQGDARDPHLVGYLLARELDRRAGTATAARLLVRYADDPVALARNPAARLPAATRAADLRLGLPAERAVIPETRFSVEDMIPDVLAVRIHAPPGQKP